MDALGRALGRVPVPWPVNLVLLDVAQDPVGDWMLERVRPFYQRAAASLGAAPRGGVGAVSVPLKLVR